MKIDLLAPASGTTSTVFLSRSRVLSTAFLHTHHEFFRSIDWLKLMHVAVCCIGPRRTARSKIVHKTSKKQIWFDGPWKREISTERGLTGSAFWLATKVPDPWEGHVQVRTWPGATPFFCSRRTWCHPSSCEAFAGDGFPIHMYLLYLDPGNFTLPLVCYLLFSSFLLVMDHVHDVAMQH